MKRRKSTRNLDNSSRRRNNNTLDLVDRISALPDSILGLILSHLPTKNAVATTILSKRWKFVWKTVHNLDFCHNDDLRNQVPEDEDKKFVRFVNRVLLLHDGGSLNKFRLVWGPRYIPSQVITCINIAITKNVHHLFVSVLNPYGFQRHFEAVEMPISLFRCDSLQSLELNGCISVSDAIVVCLPRLETLKLVSVYFWSTETFEKLICGCPMLNYLHLYMNLDDMSEYSVYNDEFNIIISSTSLRRLELGVRYGEDYPTPILHLEASSLEYFTLVGFTPQVFVQGTLSSLVEADFRIRFLYDSFSEDACNTVMNAVRAFDCAKALTLSVGVLWALSKATICLPKFRRLTKLEAGAIFCYCSSLQDLIQSSDSLEVLTIYQDTDDLCEDDLEHDDHPKWTAPVEVPRCLSNSLKVVEFKRYGGCDDDREMIGYMLKHGSVLEVMKVTSHAWNREEVNFELVKEICSFPRKSPACKVELSGEPPRSWGSYAFSPI